MYNFLEVTKTHQDQVPQGYTKQLAKCTKGLQRVWNQNLYPQYMFLWILTFGAMSRIIKEKSATIEDLDCIQF